MALSKEEIFKKIDEMVIYKNDIPIITELLKTNDPKLFIKILEEIFDGNLYWSDFEKILEPTGYTDILRDSLEQQAKLKDTISKLINFKKKLINSGIKEETLPSYAGIYKYEPGNTEYENYIQKFRESVLFQLSKIDENDSPLQMAFKIRLYNAIRNGEIMVEKKLNGEALPSLTDDNRISVVTEEASDEKEEYEFIDPEDILLFINEYYVEILEKDQILDLFDKEFMEKYNLTESQMKHFKALRNFLTGGEDE